MDVGADFAQGGGVRVRVQVVVLDLEVLAQGDEDVAALGEVGRGGELEEVQGEGDGEVEAVEGGFVGDDEGVFGGAEVVEVDVVFGGGEQVALLADFGLEGGFVEEVDEGGVGRVGFEVQF